MNKPTKEIKEKFKEHFDSGYLYLLERKNLVKAIENDFDSNDDDTYRLRCSTCIKAFQHNLTANYVITLGLRCKHDITKQKKDSIISFLKKKGFKYSSIELAYYI